MVNDITQIANRLVKEPANDELNQFNTQDISHLIEVLKTHNELSIRKNASKVLVYLLNKIEDQNYDIIIDELKQLYKTEKDMQISTNLKHAINKLNIIQNLGDNKFARYDKKPSEEEATSVLREISKLRELYENIEGVNTFNKRYRILELVEKTGLNRVFKAQRLMDGQVVIIKLFSSESLALNIMNEVKERFKREYEILHALGQFNSPYIVKVYEYGESDKGRYMVMEYLENGSIGDFISKNGKMPLQQAYNVMVRTCEAIKFIHEHGIIHRDIKPANIMLGKDGSIKLLDFGLAKDIRKPLTTYEIKMGTERYMSPEQESMSKDVDNRADIYSYGIAMYEVLTGKRFDKVSNVNINDLNVDIPDGIKKVLQQCISINREDRWKDADELLKALQALKGGIQ
jgi:serine/threonine protein kinase